MIILGIDPGTRATGYGLIEQQGNRLLHHDNGVILTRSAAAFADRLALIYDQLEELIQDFKPDAVAVEQVFVAKNPASALKLGHA